LQQYGIDGTFEKIAIEPGTFAQRIAQLRDAGYRGVNVTVPFKEEAFALAGDRHDSARQAEAANLLVFREAGIEAHNTDTYGLAQSIGTEVALPGKKAVLLGAGGAARGAVLALARLHVAAIHVLNRHAERAGALAKELQPKIAGSLVTGGLADWKAVAGDAALVVNTTSAGMKGNPPLNLDLSALPKSAAVCDIVYNPLETQLLKDAAARGHRTIDGLGMLMHQAVPSFEAFFGVKPEVTPALRAALVKELAARG
jgi:shikimate dehydrogenase